MFFRIQHTLRFDYCPAVFCEPLTVRLRPRHDAAQRLLDYSLAISPSPAGRSDFQDTDGNVATRCWFAAPTDRLEIRSLAVVETLRSNPFDFLLDPVSLTLPVVYPAPARLALAAYCVTPTSSPRTAQLARRVVEEVGGKTLPFLTRLAAAVHEACQSQVREHGPAWPAERTLSEGAGSCRDLAVLYNEACRVVGLPARFVSGYQRGDGDELPQLHAWSEVYLLEAGWRAFDASQGLAVAEDHVAVAAAAHPPDAAPTVGAFRGTGATSTLAVDLSVAASSHPFPPHA